MLLGALLDAGLELTDLERDLTRLELADYSITAEQQTRHGLSGIKFTVHDEGHHRPAHDLEAITAIIGDSDLSDESKTRSLAVFARIAEAEAQVHGVSLNEIHFHEIGAVDSLVDIVGFVCALERLKIAQVYASPIPLGSGYIQTEHGRLPVPAPATLNILAQVGAPTIASPAQTEIVTPTGAALLAHFATFTRPALRLERVGYGFGAKELPWANGLRVWLGEPFDSSEMWDTDEVLVLECNLDDTTGEILGYTMQNLLDAGALDVWFTPIQMKKNRPATMLSVLCCPTDGAKLRHIIMHETTTLGIRHRKVQRSVAQRRVEAVSTPWGAVRLKLKMEAGEVIAVAPEYEDCARLALTGGVSLSEVYRVVNELAREYIDSRHAV